MKRSSILICICIFSLIALVVLAIMPKGNGEHYIKADKKLYEKAIKYLEEEEYKVNEDSSKDDFKFFISYDGFGMTEKGDKKYAYMWVLGEGYYLENGSRESSRSYSMFFKFTFKDDKVVEYENVIEGSEYTDSIKSKCVDSKMSDKVLNYESKLSNDSDIEKYYSDKVKEN